MIASVGGVEQFAQAVVTGGDIGGDERRVHSLILRRYDTKDLLIVGIPSVGLQVCNSDMLNAGRGRRVLRQRGDKAVECLDRSMRLDVHAIARIEHPAANAMRHSLAIHKWPHANALHNARYMDMHMSHATLPHLNRPKRDRFILVGKTSKPAKTNLSLFGRCAAENPATVPGFARWRRR